MPDLQNKGKIMGTVKEALEKIKKAEKAGDEETLNKYSMDDRVSVSKAAQKVLDKIDGIDGPDDINPKEELKKEKAEPSTDGWIDMTIEESKEYASQKLLVGYNPHKSMGLLKS